MDVGDIYWIHLENFRLGTPFLWHRLPGDRIYGRLAIMHRYAQVQGNGKAAIVIHHFLRNLLLFLGPEFSFFHSTQSWKTLEMLKWVN